MNSVIEVENLRLVYGRTAAVDGVSFEVHEGEVFGLLGTNGAGKTTTLDVLEGYRPPTSGEVRVFGLDPCTERDHVAPRVGIMVQDAGFFDTLTVYQCMTAWSRFYPTHDTVEHSLDRVGLTHRGTTRCGKLSGGERRRLDLALALLGHPELLFLDEPTSGMDPEGRQETLELVRQLVDSGTTVILTTHYLEEAQQMSDRLAIMHRGRIVKQGALQDLREESEQSRVEFSVDSAMVDSLPPIPQTAIVRRPGRCMVTITTDDPQTVMTLVADWAGAAHVMLHDLQISRPSLEDIFLDIVHSTNSTIMTSGRAS